MKKVASRFDDYEPITIKCPHCGKEMVLKDKKLWQRRTFEWEDCSYYDEDSWGGYSHESESCACPTFYCEDCDITAVHLNTRDDVETDTVKGELIELDYPGSSGSWDWYRIEFIFPKNFEKTITVKQERYIESLCRQYGYIKPYFTNIELASAWLSKHVDQSKKTDFDKRVIKLIAMEFGKHGYDRKNNSCVFSPRAEQKLDHWDEALRERDPLAFKIRFTQSRTRDYSIKHNIKVDFGKKIVEMNYSISESNFDIDEMTTRLRPELKDINDEFMEIAKAVEAIWVEADKQLAAGNLDWKKEITGYYL